MSKISVTHYLNTVLKPYIDEENGKETYFVYCRMTMNRRHYLIQSREFENDVFTIDEYAAFEKTDTAKQRFLREISAVIRMVSAQLQLIPQTFDTKLFTAVYQISYRQPMLYQTNSPELYHLIDKGNGYDILKKEFHNQPKPYYETAVRLSEIVVIYDDTERSGIEKRHCRFYEAFTNEHQNRIKNALEKENLPIRLERLNAYLFSTMIYFLCNLQHISNRNKYIYDNYKDYIKDFTYLEKDF